MKRLICMSCLKFIIIPSFCCLRNKLKKYKKQQGQFHNPFCSQPIDNSTQYIKVHKFVIFMSDEMKANSFFYFCREFYVKRFFTWIFFIRFLFTQNKANITHSTRNWRQSVNWIGGAEFLRNKITSMLSRIKCQLSSQLPGAGIFHNIIYIVVNHSPETLINWLRIHKFV